MSRGGPAGPIESGLRRRGRLCRSLMKSLSATRGSDNKDIHYARRGFFPGRNERSACFAVSPCLFPGCFCVCMCLLSASAIRSSFRRASGIRDLRASTISRPERRLKCNRRKERGHGGIMTESSMELDFASRGVRVLEISELKC